MASGRRPRGGSIARPIHEGSCLRPRPARSTFAPRTPTTMTTGCYSNARTEKGWRPRRGPSEGGVGLGPGFPTWPHEVASKSDSGSAALSPTDCRRRHGRVAASRSFGARDALCALPFLSLLYVLCPFSDGSDRSPGEHRGQRRVLHRRKRRAGDRGEHLCGVLWHCRTRPKAQPTSLSGGKLGNRRSA
jgi:hypothetical protein